MQAIPLEERLKAQMDRLRALESRFNCDSKRFAQLLQVSPNTYGKWYRGERELKGASKTAVDMLELMKDSEESMTPAYNNWLGRILRANQSLVCEHCHQPIEDSDPYVWLVEDKAIHSHCMGDYFDTSEKQ